VWLSELGASLFEIAQSLFTLERTFILGAMALNKNKSEERTDKIQILSGSLMSDITRRRAFGYPRICIYFQKTVK